MQPADAVKNSVYDRRSAIANWLTRIATVLTQATQAQAPLMLEAYLGDDPFKLDRDKDSIAQRFAGLDLLFGQQLRLMMKAFFGDCTDFKMEIDRLTLCNC